MASAQAAGRAGGARLSLAGRGWTLAALYPVLVVLLALFVAYPLLDLLLKSVQVGGRLTLAPIATLLADPPTRQVLWNTLLLGVSVAIIGTILATLYAYA